jgi:hypothetical protein
MVGKERTIQSFKGFFTAMGDEVISRIVFVCSDMWEPYRKVNGENAGCCSNAVKILGNGRHFRLRDLLRHKLRTVRAYLLKEAWV